MDSCRYFLFLGPNALLHAQETSGCLYFLDIDALASLAGARELAIWHDNNVHLVSGYISNI